MTLSIKAKGYTADDAGEDVLMELEVNEDGDLCAIGLTMPGSEVRVYIDWDELRVCMERALDLWPVYDATRYK